MCICVCMFFYLFVCGLVFFWSFEEKKRLLLLLLLLPSGQNVKRPRCNQRSVLSESHHLVCSVVLAQRTFVWPPKGREKGKRKCKGNHFFPTLCPIVLRDDWLDRSFCKKQLIGFLFSFYSANYKKGYFWYCHFLVFCFIY